MLVYFYTQKHITVLLYIYVVTVLSQYLLQIVRYSDSKCWLSSNLEECFLKSLLPAPVPVRQISEGPALPSISDVKASDRFVDLWKRIGIHQLISISGFSQMSYNFYCASLRAKLKNRVCKQCGIYYPSIAACKRHR